MQCSLDNDEAYYHKLDKWLLWHLNCANWYLMISILSVGVQVLPTEGTQPSSSPASPTEGKAAEDLRSSSEDLPRKGRKKPRHKPAIRRNESPARGNWKVEGTSEWQYPADLVITDFGEFANLDIFIYKKVLAVLKLLVEWEFSQYKSRCVQLLAGLEMHCGVVL